MFIASLFNPSSAGLSYGVYSLLTYKDYECAKKNFQLATDNNHVDAQLALVEL